MYLVFDIGGTNIKIATSRDGKNLEKVEIIPTPQNFEAGISALKETAFKLVGNEEITEVCGGVPGPLDDTKNTVINFSNLQEWNNKPLKDALKYAFNAPVTLENDAAIAALGEATIGAGKDQIIVAYLTIGTGVGGARIVDQRIDANAQGFEPGHQIIVVDGKQCNCGGKGHLESYISGVSIEKNYGQRAEDLDQQSWDEVSKTIAVGINNMLVNWSPNIVVIGGSVAKSVPFERVNQHLSEMLTIYPHIPPVVKSKLADEAGLYGALALITKN